MHFQNSNEIGNNYKSTKNQFGLNSKAVMPIYMKKQDQSGLILASSLSSQSRLLPLSPQATPLLNPSCPLGLDLDPGQGPPDEDSSLPHLGTHLWIQGSKSLEALRLFLLSRPSKVLKKFFLLLLLTTYFLIATYEGQAVLKVNTVQVAEGLDF